MDASDDEAVVLQPDRFEVPVVLAAVRGVLAVALERCPAGSDAGLEICAAWEVLDGVSVPSALIEARLPTAFDSAVVVATARRLLRGAILRVEPLSSAFVLADALRHLDVAAHILAVESSCDGPSWG